MKGLEPSTFSIARTGREATVGEAGMTNYQCLRMIGGTGPPIWPFIPDHPYDLGLGRLGRLPARDLRGETPLGAFRPPRPSGTLEALQQFLLSS